MSRIETTNYNPGKGTVTVDPVTWANTPRTNWLAPAQAWQLALFDAKSASENGVEFKSEYWFDPATGFLNRMRNLKQTDGARSTADVIAVYSRDSLGNLENESYYGGDDQAVSTETLSAITLPSQPKYRLRHGYSHGKRNYTAYLDTSGNEFLRILKADIDQPSGLVKSTTDPAEVVTSYVYDLLGRITELKPTGRAWTEYTYATTATPPSVVAKARPADPTATAVSLPEQHHYYDGLGRLKQQKESIPRTEGAPGTEWAARVTTYDPAGRIDKISMPVSASSPAYEASLYPPSTFKLYGYDSLGRVKTVTSADGAIVTFGYTGVREKRRKSKIATSATLQQEIETTERFDGAGRLVEVVEKSGPTSAVSPIGADVTTEYTYDAADRLRTVQMSDTAGIVQNRIFDYDGRGFLVWESHPEAGITAYSYDARGNALAKSHGGAQSPFDLKYVYDQAERLVKVDGRNPFHDPADPEQPAFHVLKEFAFATANDTSSTPDDRRKGKLLTATRYNYSTTLSPIGAGYLQELFKVKEIYSYKDAAGRRTDRRTEITKCCFWNEPDQWREVKKIDTKIAYDDLDQPSKISYPVCFECGFTQDHHPALDVQPTYEHGRLKSIPSFVNSVTYWPNGMRKTLLHSNSIVDTQTQDPHRMARPGSIGSGLYNSCTAPSIDVHPAGGTTSTSSPSVLLSVTVSGTGPFTYQWYAFPSAFPAGAIPGATSSSYLASPTATTRYSVEVTNNCNTIGVESRSATVTVGPCQQPTVNISETRNPNGSWTLDAHYATGTEPYSFSWFRLPGNVPVGTGRKIVVEPAQTTTYELRLTNDCGTATRSLVVTIPLPMTVLGLRAEKNAIANRIDLTWPASAGATGYTVIRREAGQDWSSIGQTSVASYSDSNITANKVYLYRVSATDGNGSGSAYSNADVATTMVFPTVAAGSLVSASAFNQMLQAVNSVRQLSGWPALTWANIIAPSNPLPAPGNVVLTVHITACRARLNEALSAVGVPVAGYTDPDLSGVVIRAIYVNEIQGRLQ